MAAGLRILLFGTPGAGKSSLLGALAQAAAAQPALLKGTLVEDSHQLAELQAGTYQDKLPSTEQTTTYDVRLQPAAGAGPEIRASIIDCSGKVAREMLQSKQPFSDPQPMKKPILDADTVILAVDASLPGKQLAEEFQQFAHWLLQFHATRGKRTDVGGLPVYLVLTKCDLLAKPNDTFSLWMQRIEEGKRRIDQKFREYLKSQGTGFGSIQLQLWATSIRRATLADRPARDQEPHGVAELFRQGLQSAQEYQERRQHSQSRLQNVVMAMTCVVALLALTVGFLVEYQPVTKHSSLEEKLQEVMPKKDEERLRASIKTLESRRDRLAAMQSDPEFEHLPGAVQERINQYRSELTHYLRLYHEAQSKLKPPHTAKNEDEFTELKKNLEAFTLPETHASDKAWQETKLVRRVDLLRKEFAQVDNALKEQEAWFQQQIKKNEELLRDGSKIYDKLLFQQKLQPQEAEIWNLGYREQMQPRSRKQREEYIRGTRMTYEDLQRFPEFQRAQKEWNDSRAELKGMADNIQKRKKTSS